MRTRRVVEGGEAPMTETSPGSVVDGGRAVLDEYTDLEQRLADPEVFGDQTLVRTLNKRYAALAPTVAAYRAVETAEGDLAAARELATEDESFAAEVPALRETADAARAHLRHLLVPRDPDDDRDVILEVKAGEGGEESALFAGDLLRMYLRYAEKRGWRAEVTDATESDLGGYKEARLTVKAKGTPQPGEAPWAMLKFEGGVHRVQRVPVTESQGRIHTSAAGVLVMPEVEETDEVDIHPNDIRVDVYRSSGPGGQSVNTTDSAVRITHLPTGIVVSCQNEKSQLQNKEAAMRVLRARLHQAAKEQADAEASAARRSQVRTVDRSERIRTYNYPENRLSDHRTGFKAYNLDAVLDGDLDAVIGSCVEADEQARLTAVAGE
jgi:peptide chain release factor 1